VIHSYADGRIEDTGPLTRNRMKDVGQEFLDAVINFIKRQHEAGKPFFVWFNTTRMHFRTHIPDRIRGHSGRWQTEYHDAMIEHDRQIGVLLDLLDEIGIQRYYCYLQYGQRTNMNSWPNAAMTPFRNEKNSCRESAFRVPEVIRWPGEIRAGMVSNKIVRHLDWLPTSIAAAGEPDIKEKLKKATKQETKI
jgi:arylsulfatase